MSDFENHARETGGKHLMVKPLDAPQSYGHYVITFGQYKGLRISQLSDADRRSYVEYLERIPNLSGTALEFVEYARAYSAELASYCEYRDRVVDRPYTPGELAGALGDIG